MEQESPPPDVPILLPAWMSGGELRELGQGLDGTVSTLNILVDVAKRCINKTMSPAFGMSGHRRVYHVTSPSQR